MATEILRPNGAGDETGIQNVTGAATHWQAVDEAVADDATTTVHHDTDNASGRDLYAIQSTAVGAGTINSVTIFIRFEGTTGWSKTAIKTNGTVYESSQLSSGGDETWSTQSVVYTTNPNTGAAWTWSEIASLQIGARNFRSASQQGRITQIYAQIDYTPASFGVIVGASIPSATFSTPSRNILFDFLHAVSALSATLSVPTYTPATGNTVSAGALAATLSIPAYNAGIITVVTPAAQSVAFSVPAYSIITNYLLSIAAAVGLALSAPAPTVSEGAGATVLASALAGSINIPAHTVSVVANIIITPAAQALTFTAPTIAKVGAIWNKISRSTSAVWTRVGRNST